MVFEKAYQEGPYVLLLWGVLGTMTLLEYMWTLWVLSLVCYWDRTTSGFELGFLCLGLPVEIWDPWCVLDY